MWAAKAGVLRSSHFSSKSTLDPSDSNFASPSPSVMTGGFSSAPESSASNFSSSAYATPAVARTADRMVTITTDLFILPLLLADLPTSWSGRDGSPTAWRFRQRDGYCGLHVHRRLLNPDPPTSRKIDPV